MAAWAMGRVNSFLKGSRKHDLDLRKKKKVRGKTVSSHEFCNWTHQEHNKYSICFCGKFASFGFNYRFGMLELLCSEHYLKG